ncbi:hypothetical protein HYC85_010724 [Camellia sinensis]|uniref:Uncharacterized protein n=1 Tax=Camellia sinensis TaxID=4442 RepID=A0A7J7HIP6_CAMSI|nr:hypothetical protein HYC85_010724 [Camellia sinensis]
MIINGPLCHPLPIPFPHTPHLPFPIAPRCLPPQPKRLMSLSISFHIKEKDLQAKEGDWKGANESENELG